ERSSRRFTLDGTGQGFVRKNTPFASAARATRSDVTNDESGHILFAWSKSQLNTPATCIATRRTALRNQKFPPTRRAITRAKAKLSRRPTWSPRLSPRASAQPWESKRRTLELICAE